MLPHEATQERRNSLERDEHDATTKLIVILGGESEQGSSVISALLSANAQAFNLAAAGTDANGDHRPLPSTTATARSSSRVHDSTSWPPPPKNHITNDVQQSQSSVTPVASVGTSGTSMAIAQYHQQQKINHRPSTAPPSTTIPSSTVTSIPIPIPIPISSTTHSALQSFSRQRLGPFLDDSFLDTSTTVIQTPPLSPGSIDEISPFSISTPLIADDHLGLNRVDIVHQNAIEDRDGSLGLSNMEISKNYSSSEGSSSSTSTSSNHSSPPRIVSIMPSSLNVKTSIINNNIESSIQNQIQSQNHMKIRSSSLGVTSNPFSLTLTSSLDDDDDENKKKKRASSIQVNNNITELDVNTTNTLQTHQPPWRVRAILRSNKENEVDGDIAFQLRARGVELSYVDFDELDGLDEKSKEEDKMKSIEKSGLKGALEGAWGVLVAPIDRDGFAVGSALCGFTGFSTPSSLTAEEEAEGTEKRGKLVVDAAATSGVTHFIWCCTGDIQRVMKSQDQEALTPGGTTVEVSSPSSETLITPSGTVSAHSGYISPTMEQPPEIPPISILAHASVQRYLNEKVKKKQIKSCSTLAVALPFENFVFSKADGGFYLETTTPTNEALPFCSIEDIGTCALLAFNSPSRYNLSHIDVVAELNNPLELSAQLTQIIYISSKRVLPFPNVSRADFENSRYTTFNKDQETWKTLKWLMSWAKSKAGARGGLGSGGRDGFAQAKNDYFHSRDPTFSMNVYLASKLTPWRDYATTAVDDLLPSWRDFSNPSTTKKPLPFFQAPERFTHSVHSSLSNNLKCNVNGNSPSSLNGLSHSLANTGLVASGLSVSSNNSSSFFSNYNGNGGINGNFGNDSMPILSLPLPIPASSALPVSAVISSVTSENPEPVTSSILRNGFPYQGPPISSSPSPSPPPTSPRIDDSSSVNNHHNNKPLLSSPSKISNFSSGMINSDSSTKIVPVSTAV